jgi:hypothetical protein
MGTNEAQIKKNIKSQKIPIYASKLKCNNLSIPLGR